MHLRADVELDPEAGLRVPAFRLAGERAVITGSVRIPAGFQQLVVEAGAEVPDGSILSSSLGVPVAGRALAECRGLTARSAIPA